MVRSVTSFEDNFHLTYPHNNGFTDNGRGLILGRNSEKESSLWKIEEGGNHRELCRFERESQPEKMLWFDVAGEVPVAVTIADKKLWRLDLGAPGESREIYAAPEGKWLHAIPAIRADGKLALCGLHGPRCFEALLVDVDSGSARVLFEKPWMTNHFHFCPFDPEWIGFSHEGNCAKVMDRVWAWHAEKAAQGSCFFEQMPTDPERTLFAGHERWCFHDRSVMVVAYGEGPGRPRGIYEAFTDGRPQRFVSEGDRDMHLDVSRDGQWIVIDTSGPLDASGKGWENSHGISDIVVAARATGERRVVARSTISKHPSHPHPVFSPDARLIYYNEGSADGLRNRVCCVENPFLT